MPVNKNSLDTTGIPAFKADKHRSRSCSQATIAVLSQNFEGNFAKTCNKSLKYLQSKQKSAAATIQILRFVNK